MKMPQAGPVQRRELMKWERVKQQLEEILKAPFQFEKIMYSQWTKEIRNDHSAESSDRSFLSGGKLRFFLYQEGSSVHTLNVEAALLTPAERKLAEMAVDLNRSQSQGPRASSQSMNEEGRALALHNWLQNQQAEGIQSKELPESFSSWSALYSNKIPLLLYNDSNHPNVSYSELGKLLESFFETEIILIPVTDREWLILAPESLILDIAEEGAEGEESLEDALASIGSGLYEMMTSEWIGECHLSVTYPMVPAKYLLSSLVQLKESIHLGRTFHLEQNIHLPWQLHLDKLLQALPEQEKNLFMERILKRMDVFEAEMLYTLEKFFDLDCNVSESAKELFIHRNTLLYRLDKFRQETGMDVRAFNQAVLVKIALQLYKVTKRK